MISRWYADPRAPLVYLVALTVVAAFAFGTAGVERRRISANQQRIIEQQQLLEKQQVQIDNEIAARIEAVCQTAIDTRDIFRRTVAVLEQAAPPESLLHQPTVKRRLAKILADRPVQCDVEPP